MLTVNDVAKRWKCSPQLVYALVAEGKIQCFRLGLGRGTIRFSEEQLQAFLETVKVTPAPASLAGLKHLRLDG